MTFKEEIFFYLNISWRNLKVKHQIIIEHFPTIYIFILERNVKWAYCDSILTSYSSYKWHFPLYNGFAVVFKTKQTPSLCFGGRVGKDAFQLGYIVKEKQRKEWTIGCSAPHKNKKKCLIYCRSLSGIFHTLQNVDGVCLALLIISCSERGIFLLIQNWQAIGRAEQTKSGAISIYSAKYNIEKYFVFAFKMLWQPGS